MRRRRSRSATSRRSTSIPSSSISIGIVMEDVGVIDPDSIEDAIARGAYSALLQSALRDDAGRGHRRSDGRQPARPRRRGLPGRHQVGERPQGAQPRPSSSSATRHEGEPNVYKDRRIHEGDPHRILEGHAHRRRRRSAPSGPTTTSAASTRWPSSASARRSPTPSGSA